MTLQPGGMGEQRDGDNESRRLMNEVLELCNRKDRKGPENILLIGQSGSGKSAAINSLITALTGTYFDKAIIGRDKPKTVKLTHFKHCGVVEDDIQEQRARCLITKEHLNKLPNITEVPGLDDKDSYCTKELLRLLLSGRIPQDTNIPDLIGIQEREGEGFLDTILPDPDQSKVVNKVVFVQSAVDTIHESLIRCLHSVLQETDPKTLRLVYDVDVFLLLTHVDCVWIARIPEDRRPYIGRTEFEQVEQSLDELFSISGARERNRLKMKNFCDAVGYDDELVCQTALKLLRFCVSPSTPRTEPVSKPVDTRWKIIQHRVKKRLPEITLLLCGLLLAGVVLKRM